MAERSRSPVQDFFAKLGRGKPLAILGLAPQVDQAALKEAYLRKVARHPPHEDPAAFRRIRQAYETLSVPGALEAAGLLAPPDPARLHEQFVAPLADTFRPEEPAEEGQAGDPLERWGRLSWTEVAGG